jgi:hypothetical protein
MTKLKKRTHALESIGRAIAVVSEGDERLHFLLMCSIGRILAKKDFVQETADREELSSRVIKHIVDWLRAAIFNDAPWLANVDHLGRPKKLLKFGSVDAMVAEVDRDMIRQARCNGTPKDSIEGVEPYMELGEGWRLVRLMTAAALDFESSIMQHCIGNGGYDDQLADPSRVFISLRDPYGNPHVTLSMSGNDIEELSGKQNQPPHAKYLKRLVPYFQNIGELAYLDGSYGIVLDLNGSVYGYDDLPEVLEVASDLHLNHENPQGMKCRLPRIIKAGGAVVIEEDVFEGQLEMVEAAGLDCSGTGMLAKNCDFKIRQEIIITGSDIEVLPDNLSIMGNLQLKGASVARLPTKLYVGGELDIKGTDIKLLPDDLSVGSIRIENTDVTSLGSLRSLKDLRAAYSKLTHLPDNLIVEGLLDISESALTAIPEGIKVYGGMSATGCEHIRLPRRLDVGFADLSRSGVYMAPGDFECTAGMNLNAARIVFRGRRVACGGKLNLAATHYDRLPDVIRAPEVNLERRLARDLRSVDSDIVTDVLAMSDADAEISSSVIVRERIDIVELGGTRWSFPVDGARQYLANRAAFHSIVAACNHFGGSLGY